MIELNPSPYPAAMCDACGRWPVACKGFLCHTQDKDDTWGCSEKAAWFAIRFNLRARKLSIRWGQA
jgi:hypothetical protein